jgi:GNAT superfamily N-acetyltransferase
MFLRDISLEDAYEILSDVEPDLSRGEFLAQYKDRLKGDVKILGLFDKESLCNVTVVSIQENDIQGKYLYLYDLVTHKKKRKKGYGKEMLKYVQNLAIYNGCSKITLNSGLHRTDEHKFLKSNGFEMFHYAFVKELKNNG